MSLLGAVGVVEYSLIIDRKELFMKFICKLNQHVVHTFWGAARPRHEVGEYFRNSREYPEFSASLVILLGKYFATLDFPQC